jgi:DNA polymerase III subunit gamma/tau
MIAHHASGSLRDAESLLDQLVTVPGETISLARTRQVLGTAPAEAVGAVTEAWLQGDGAAGLAAIHAALDHGADARQFARQMVAHLRQLLLLQATGGELDVEGPVERKATMMAQAQRAPRRALIEATRRFHEAAMQPAGSWQPQLPLELAFLELLPETPQAWTMSPPAASESVNDANKDEPPPSPTPSHRKPAPAKTKKADSPIKESADPETISPAASAATPTLTVAAIAGFWPEMTQVVGRKMKNLPALLAMCKPLAIEGVTIVLGFDYPLLREKFDKTPGAAAVVTDAFRALSGVECAIRTVVTTDYPVPIRREDFQALANELGGVVRED